MGDSVCLAASNTVVEVQGGGIDKNDRFGTF